MVEYSADGGIALVGIEVENAGCCVECLLVGELW